MAVNQCYSVKPSPNKKSIFGMTPRSQILYLLLLAGIFATASADTELSCKNVKSYFEKKGILQLMDIQEKPNTDLGGVCLSPGCCGNGAKRGIIDRAKSQLEAALMAELNKMADLLANRARKFDDSFRKLLQSSKEEFHNMFKRTYGMIYEQHSYVFQQLFDELERYYTAGDANFMKMMEKFFGILYEKMFTVLNSQYSFDEKYLKCVNEHMRDIQPFEDVPAKLTVQLQRVFVASRTFYKALKSGAEVVRAMTKVGVTEDCAISWARLRFCGACAGQQPPACSRYCHNVIKGCLPSHADLGEQWDAYVDGVEKVADRLLGPFNIAMVIEPLDIKISEAIMSFQEHNQEISQKIFSGCGKPVLGGGAVAGPFFTPDKTRTARSIRSLPSFETNLKEDNDFEIETSFESIPDDSMALTKNNAEDLKRAVEEMKEQTRFRERFLSYMRDQIPLEELEKHERLRRNAEPEPEGIDFRAFEFEGERKKKKKPVKTDYSNGERSGQGIDQVVRETRGRVRSSRKYWSLVPAVLCTSASVTTSPCFNGSAVATYTHPSAGEGSAAVASNPEALGWKNHISSGVGTVGGTQRDALRELAARLRDAYNGHEVVWPHGDLQAASSTRDFIESDGSGSGSGDDFDDTDDLPDDDEDRNDYNEGSGDRQPNVAVETPVNTPEASEPPPFIPSIIDTPGTNNINIRGRVSDVPVVPGDTSLPGVPSVPESGTNDGVASEDKPVTTGSAERPSLSKALFTYALPVVCAWFGTIITDLF